MYKSRYTVFILIGITILIFLVITFVIPSFKPNFPGSNVKTKEIVFFQECIDGDTAKYKDGNGKIFSVRYAGINSPESRSDKRLGIKEEEYGKEAKDYSCQKIKQASKLEFEDDPSQDDSYERKIGTIFYDNINLSVDLVTNGYASTKYLTKGNPYYKELQEAEAIAKDTKKGIWS
jgi:endonuclease YncB( thermonuclease family)